MRLAGSGLWLTLAGLGCTDGADGGPPTTDVPVARIEGASLRAGYDTLVTLDGSRSRDPAGRPLTFRWRIVSGPDVSASIRRVDRERFTFRTARASALFAVRPRFGPVPIPRGGEGETVVELVVSNGRRHGRARARVRSAGTTGGWPRVESGLDLTVLCGGREDGPARWRLTETPAGSRAVVLEAERCLARVRADRPGRYVLTEEQSGRTLPFWYGDWVGHEECGRTECHPTEHATWRTTKHATVLERALDGQLGPDYGPECIGCHVLGVDPASTSPGFASVAADLHWTAPRPAAGTSARLAPGLRLWGNVQCEQCHGPGRFWTGLTAEVCAQCHDRPPRYTIVAEWRRSRMSVPPSGTRAARADCGRCHTAHGAIGGLDGRSWPRPREEPDPQAVTCPVCHDPHERRGPAALRRSGAVEVAGRAIEAGTGAICFACHGGFDGPATVGEGRAPHAPQGWMIVQPAPGASAAPHASVPNLCVGCHMARDRGAAPLQHARAAEPALDRAGGHTFLLRAGDTTLDLACRPCHADVRALEVGGGRATRRLAEQTALLRARVRAAAAALEIAGCDGSRPADVGATDGRLELADALGRPLTDCGRTPLPLPRAARALSRAAALLLVVEEDGSRGAHNAALADRLVQDGLRLLGP